MPKQCQVIGCNNNVWGKGYCKIHQYYRTDKKEKKVSTRFIQEEDDLQTLIDDLDEVTSRMIRFKYAGKDGLVECFTCDAKHPISHIQCGHFIPRLHMATRFLTDNLRPQCKTCNEYKQGNLTIFAERLEKEKGGITEWLHEQANTVHKFTRTELKELLLEYRQKLQLYQSKFK
jgi:hypothetical protein